MEEQSERYFCKVSWNSGWHSLFVQAAWIMTRKFCMFFWGFINELLQDVDWIGLALHFLKKNKSLIGVINDPHRQPHSPFISDHCFHWIYFEGFLLDIKNYSKAYGHMTSVKIKNNPYSSSSISQPSGSKLKILWPTLTSQSLAHNSEFPYVKCNYIWHIVRAWYPCMCIQMVSNDCKKLQVVWLYVNKPVVVGNCPYKG